MPGPSLAKHRKVILDLLSPWIVMTLLLFISMIVLPIFAQCSLASTTASRSASEAPAVEDAAAEVMYVSGANLKTFGWEHAAKRVSPRLNMTLIERDTSASVVPYKIVAVGTRSSSGGGPSDDDYNAWKAGRVFLFMGGL